MGRASRRKSMTKAEKRTLVNRVLRAFIGELRVILRRVAPSFYQRYPNATRPCHSCAFNPGTDDWQGFDTTANGLMKAIRDDRPFYCHENIPWKKPIAEWTTEDHRHFKEHGKLCAGFAAIQGDPETKLAFMRAALGTTKSTALALCAVPGAGEVFNDAMRKMEQTRGDLA